MSSRKIMLFITILLLLTSLPPVRGIEGNDSGWSKIETPFEDDIESIHMLSENDGWVLLDYGPIYRWNGENWIEENNPAGRPTFPQGIPLNSIHMLSTNYGWAVGTSDTFIQWNGENWTEFEGAFASTNYFSGKSVQTLSENSAWAVGLLGYSDQPEMEAGIAHWNGIKWENVPTPKNSAFLNSVHMISENEGWAVGAYGTILYWDGDNWSKVTSPTDNGLTSIHMLSSNDGWAVGDYGTILHWNGENWSKVESPTENFLKSIYMTSPNDGWAVGGVAAARNGVILYWDGSQWSLVKSVDDELLSIYMTSPNNGWAVGKRGIILRYTRPEKQVKRASEGLLIMIGVSMIIIFIGIFIYWKLLRRK